MNKFRNKYRIQSSRLNHWDYGADAAYFVTICTKNRNHFFGEISNGVMKLSTIGHVANSCWHEIPKHFPFVELGAHIIMPDHMHGIVIINKRNDDGNTDVFDRGDDVETPNLGVSSADNGDGTSADNGDGTSADNGDGTSADDNGLETPKLGVSTNAASAKWDSGSLGVIINQYKRVVTLCARKTNPEFGWQTRFYDRIIRDDCAYDTITRYIIANPVEWHAEKT